MTTVNSNANTNPGGGMDRPPTQTSLSGSVTSPTSPVNAITLNKPPQLNSVTLSKALTKPPPLSSVLQLPKNALLNNNTTNNTAPNAAGLQINGAAKSATSSLSPSPAPPLIGSNLIAQTRTAELANHTPPSNNGGSFSPSLSFQNQQAPHTFSNSMPAATTAQLFPAKQPQAPYGTGLGALSTLAAALPQSSPQLSTTQTIIPPATLTTVTPTLQTQFQPFVHTAASSSMPSSAASSLAQSLDQTGTQTMFNRMANASMPNSSSSQMFQANNSNSSNSPLNQR